VGIFFGGGGDPREGGLSKKSLTWTGSNEGERERMHCLVGEKNKRFKYFIFKKKVKYLFLILFFFSFSFKYDSFHITNGTPIITKDEVRRRYYFRLTSIQKLNTTSLAFKKATIRQF
jgi:hypothetical protein